MDDAESAGSLGDMEEESLCGDEVGIEVAGLVQKRLGHSKGSLGV